MKHVVPVVSVKAMERYGSQKRYMLSGIGMGLMNLLGNYENKSRNDESDFGGLGPYWGWTGISD